MAENNHRKKITKINPNFKIKNIYSKSRPKSQKQTYKIIKKIGEGSFGVVYLAQYLKTSSLCVIKKIDFGGLTKEEIKESYNEVNILKKLDHPNIIKFIEVKPSKKNIEIITEYADKGDLYNQLLIQKEKNIHFTEETIQDWLIQTCQALKYIHSKHIIHRDIKPHNIFLTKKGSIKLGDFGISKRLNNTLEKAKTFVGTAFYLPPEVINGKKYSYSADIWSLGVTFYQLMTFKPPFNGDSLPGLLKKIINEEKYEKISKKYYSKDLIHLIYKMMDFRPSHRPKPNDILNMDFIQKRIKKYLEENKYDDILTKTIIKKYQDNHNKKLEEIKEEKEEQKEEKEIKEEKDDIINIKEKENNEEHFSFKNKIKFNNIINNENISNLGTNNPNLNNNNVNNINISNTKNSSNDSKKEKPRYSLNKIKLSNNSELNNNNNKEKEKEPFEFPKIKIKIIPSTKKKEEKKDASLNNKSDKSNNFDSTLKTNMTSYNPEESTYKFKFDDDFIEQNKIVHENNEEEIDLSNENNYFFLETRKEDQMNQELKEEYDYLRNLNMLNSTMKGKSENEIEMENKLINHNISDIEENDKESEEDIGDNNNKNKNC